ncbi:hypothetical protein FS837_001341 [Tulasnella sp. UAMH 9824]|nr:hypothetical protein FS837_001341 [Tulasnella sp. UAMH 9824]
MTSAVSPPSLETPSQGKEELFETEKQWLSRYEVLKAHGYILRPRYRPGWVASWKAENLPLFKCEDSVLPLAPHLDAERISDGQQVFLKAVPKSSPEVEIGKYLSSPELRHNPRNHSIPLFDVLDDPVVPGGVILVLPLLRLLGEPLPDSVREALEIVEQTLEIAHRDCAFDNILMDGRALFPNGWHPQTFLATRDALDSAGRPALREVRDLRYYFIDFGLSTHGESMTLGEDGQEEAPELSLTVPYDPYKLDVYILGKAYARFFLPRFARGEFTFLMPLVAYMTPKLPPERPTAEQALERFKELRASLPEAELSRRLRPPQAESTIDRIRNDAWHRFSDYRWNHWKTKRAVGPLE